MNMIMEQNKQQSMTAKNPVRSLWHRLEHSFADSAEEAPTSAAIDCLPVLLQFLEVTDWAKGKRRLFESMPHVDRVDTLPAFRSVLYRLGFKTTIEPFSSDNLRREYFPCFLLQKNGNIILIDRFEDDGTVHCFDASDKSTSKIHIDELDGTLIFPEDMEDSKRPSSPQKKWLQSTIRYFHPLIGKIFLLSFIINGLALCLPLFVMTVYDKAIGADALNVLFGLFVGVLLIVSAEFLLRMIRARLQAYLGARLDNQINEVTFRQILHLPLQFTEDAPLGSQLTRLKQMTSIRDAFTGMLASAFFDLPFIILFLITIALIGGNIVLAPVALIICYGVMAAWALPMTKARVRESGEKRTQLSNLVVEAISTKNAIRDLNAEENWLNRHRQLSAESAIANLKSRQINTLTQTLSQAFLTMAGVLTLAIGVQMVLAGTLTAGALIAVMALTWRVLNPIRNFLLSSLTLGQTIQSAVQINCLLQLLFERTPNTSPSIARTFTGAINFDRVSFRYPTQKEPSLRAVSFTAEPGQLLCICGQSGSGKTTTLRMLIGLYQQQAGSIFIDGLDLRQLDRGEWRQSLGVALEESHFYFGTIAQNIRLAHPAATDEEIETIAKKLGLHEFYDGVLKNGIETKISANSLATWPDALKKRLSLCRAFIKEAPIYLLDNPADSLDTKGEEALISLINEKRATSTIIMTTHRPSHMHMANQVMWLDHGLVKGFDKPGAIVPQLLSA